MTLGPRFRFDLGHDIFDPLLAKNANKPRVEKKIGGYPENYNACKVSESHPTSGPSFATTKANKLLTTHQTIYLCIIANCL